jgi:hypothetical protein
VTTPDPRGTYAEAGDLIPLIGDLRLPASMPAEAFLAQAADEIDSYLGFIYKTPFDLSADSKIIAPAKLLLKRVNLYLAAGRALMAMNQTGEDNRVHAYGQSLVEEAEKVLCEIRDGNAVLPGADPLDPNQQQTLNVPQISNVDPESNVEAFYNRVTNPYYAYFGSPLSGAESLPPYPYPGGLIR